MKRKIAAVAVIVGLPALLPLGCGSDSCEEAGTCSSYDGPRPQCDGYFHNADGSIATKYPKLGSDGVWRWPDGREWDDPAKPICDDAGTDAEGSAGSGGTGGTGGTGGDAGAGGVGGTGGTGGTGGEDAGGDADAGAAGMGGDDAGDAEAEPFCDPNSTPDEDPCVIHDDHGIFVSPSGTDSGSCGTMLAPCATIAQGISRAKATDKRVYACGDGVDYTESLSITASSSGLKPIYGGFHCSDWSYEPAAVRAHVLPAAEGVALSIDGATAIEFNDFSFEARTATVAGTSSIAAVVNASTGVLFRNTHFTAGAGAKGADGVDGAKGADGEIADAAQNGRGAECNVTDPFRDGPLASEASACGSRGGNGGGAVRNNYGVSGSAGTPDSGVTPAGIDNKGAGATVVGTTGGLGLPGSPGDIGGNAGAAPTAGTFAAAGFAAADGSAGTPGMPGQGGGGGGGSAAPSSASPPCIGATGGAGGMGGCGGTHGTGGKGGGASVALLVWQSDVSLDSSVLTSAVGGAGGLGGTGGAKGLGQEGGGGGQKLGSIAAGGDGGKGGDGGIGGSGSAGTGGPSYAIVYHGTAPTQLGTVTLTPGSGGTKGTGGQAPGGQKAPDGSDGDSLPTFVVP